MADPTLREALQRMLNRHAAAKGLVPIQLPGLPTADPLPPSLPLALPAPLAARRRTRPAALPARPA